jgi:NAD(P)-dependent dehydrogenase (short-subunit alcohol dehydrogenase family)
MLDLSLEGKVAIITGGSKGIGKAVALRFAEHGADVALAARGEEDLNLVAKEVEGLGRRALAVPTDVQDQEQVQNLIDRTVAELGGIDVLVNNAGAAPFFSTIESLKPSGFEKYFRTNFHSAFFATQAAAPHLQAKGSRASVINVASVAGFIADPGLSYYGAAKAAMVSLTRTAALEWAGHGVRVNAIAPGWVESEMNAVARQDPAFTQNVISMIPLGRWGTPEEIANVALFLASDAAAFMTGSVVVIDGGQTLLALHGGH